MMLNPSPPGRKAIEHVDVGKDMSHLPVAFCFNQQTIVTSAVLTFS